MPLVLVMMLVDFDVAAAEVFATPKPHWLMEATTLDFAGRRALLNRILPLAGVVGTRRRRPSSRSPRRLDGERALMLDGRWT